MDHLDIILKNKGYTIWDVVCQVSGNNPPVEDPEDTDCETLTGADGTDGFSSGDTGWAPAGQKPVTNMNVKAGTVRTACPD